MERKIMYQLYFFFLMATPVRFELTHRGVKFHCLTTWLRGNVAVYGRIELPSQPWQGRILTDERIDHIILNFTWAASEARTRTPLKWCTLPIELMRHIKEVTCVIAITSLFNCTQFEFRIFLMSTGASRRARTFDLTVNSRLLCQLSYRGINHEGGNPHIIYG